MYSLLHLLLCSMREDNDEVISVVEEVGRREARSRQWGTLFRDMFDPEGVITLEEHIPITATLDAYCVMNDEIKNTHTHHFDDDAVANSLQVIQNLFHELPQTKVQ